MRKRKNKGRNVQRERRIFHGDYLDVHSFPVFQKPGKRKKKTNPSSEIQKKLNQTYRENKVTYLINENFDKTDIEVGYGYSDEYLPDTYEDVKKDVYNFHRRVGRFRKALGLPELKYLYVIQKGEINGRFHMHDVMSGGKVKATEKNIKKIKRFFPNLSEQELKDEIEYGGYRRLIEILWGKGYAHTYRLEFDDEGLKGLAKYKIRDPQTDIEFIDGKVRRWASSKNLKQPTIPKDRDGYISKDTVRDIRKGDICERDIERLYPGYTVTSVEPFLNTINAGEYLTIRLRKTKSIRIEKEVFYKCRE